MSFPLTVGEEDPAKWKDMELFTNIQERVNMLNVVNDMAEHGVALVQEFMKAGLIQDGEQV